MTKRPLGKDMLKIDSARELYNWFLTYQRDWAAQSMTANIRTSDQKGLNKAVVTLHASTHVASIAVWDNGLLEFAALDLATKTEVHVNDKEFGTARELQLLLDQCSRTFTMLIDHQRHMNYSPQLLGGVRASPSSNKTTLH